jgi:hypothetical protein
MIPLLTVYSNIKLGLVVVWWCFGGVFDNNHPANDFEKPSCRWVWTVVWIFSIRVYIMYRK